MQKKILLIVQNGRVRSTLQRALIDLGYKVETCTNSRAASSACYAFLPDLIFCQRELPDISGVKLAGLLKSHSQFSHTPILLIVPDATTSHPDGGGNILFTTDDLLAFPFTDDALHHTLSKWLGFAETVPEEEKEPAPRPHLPMRIEEVEGKQLQTNLRGKISSTSLCRLLYNLMKNKESGVLTVRSSKNFMDVSIRAGTVVDITSNFIREDSLGNYLVQEKIISPKENLLSYKRMQEFKQSQGQILVWMKSVDQQALDTCLSDQKRQKFLRLFKRKWKGALFEFKPQPVSVPEGAMKPLPLGEAIKTGIFKYSDPDDLYQSFLRNSKLDCPLCLGKKADLNLERLDIHKTMMELARCLEGKSINDLRKAYPEQFDSLLRLAFLLLINRVAVFEDPPPRGNTLPFDRSKMRRGEITKKRVTPKFG